MKKLAPEPLFFTLFRLLLDADERAKHELVGEWEEPTIEQALEYPL